MVNLEPSAEQRVVKLPPSGDVSDSEPQSVTYACFASEGVALVGTSQGSVHVVNTQTRAELHVVRVPGGAAIKSLFVSRDGKSFLCNSADRVIRTCALERIFADERPPLRGGGRS